ncbi:MAG: hypothetical protein V6Z89_10810 [Desulfobacter sp.]
MVKYEFETQEKLLFIVPILCWLFIAYGIIYPFENSYLKTIWYIDIFLSAGVHTAMLLVAIPLGKRSGYSALNSIWFTLLLGATWWKPLKKNLDQAR